MAITSESQLIDVATIKAGCNKIKSSTNLITDYAKGLRNASSYLGEKSFSFSGKTIQPVVNETADFAVSLKDTINSVANEISSAASALYDKQYAELQAYRASQQKYNE